MKSIRQHIHGILMSEAGHSALLLHDANPAEESETSLYLRYAFTRRGSESPVFPAFILDDWGSEIKGRALYEWFSEFGEQFPRAELFGFDLSGSETQCFLRELELYRRPLCYAYSSKEAPLIEGCLIEAILLPDAATSAPERRQPPEDIRHPLRAVKVPWWTVNPDNLDLSQLLG